MENETDTVIDRLVVGECLCLHIHLKVVEEKK